MVGAALVHLRSACAGCATTNKAGPPHADGRSRERAHAILRLIEIRTLRTGSHRCWCWLRRPTSSCCCTSSPRAPRASSGCFHFEGTGGDQLHHLEQIDSGKVERASPRRRSRSDHEPPANARLRDAGSSSPRCRADEAEHRDVNHGFAEQLRPASRHQYNRRSPSAFNFICRWPRRF